MASYKMVVLTNPLDGRHAEFNDWYDSQHLDDLLELEGMQTAQRYRLKLGDGWSYMAIYDVETDDLDGLMTEMYRRADSGEIYMSPAFDNNYLLVAGEAIGGLVRSKPSEEQE